ncbi:MAG: FimB/Mfa2 family fimbrial subunit [Alistipes sp.]|nr:FimB/Mfa2 family fimbrial subunit [Alistipes sp.]
MKNFLHPILIAVSAITAVSCSIKEDIESCFPPPKPAPDSIYVYLAFECIEIYDTDREIVFDKIVDELELLFYNRDGKLAYDLHYTAVQLEEYDWRVRLHDNLVKPGDYTLLALVNYRNDHYTMTGKESLVSLLAGLEYDKSTTGNNGSPEIDFPLTDTYYGRHNLELRYTSLFNEHKVMLSKNTNLFNVTVFFREESDYNSVLSVVSRITGNNTLYDWENHAVDAPEVNYLPYSGERKEPEFSFTDSLKTMRVWHRSDLELKIDITTDQEVINLTESVPEWLAGIEKYDTDEKLEHYDEFDIRITLGESYVIVGVEVNGWYVVKDEGGL